MSPDKAVMTSAIVTLTSTTAGNFLPSTMGGKGQLPPARQLFGTAIAFMGLSILADVAPPVGVGLAACIAFTALTYYGVPIADKYFSDQPTP